MLPIMATFDVKETERVEALVQKLYAIKGANDELVFGGDAMDPHVRQIPYPPQDVVAECAAVAELFRSRDVEAPHLNAFVSDPSPFAIKKLMHELRNIENTYGEE